MGDFIEVVLNTLTKTPGEDSNTWLGWLLETCRKSWPMLSEPLEEEIKRLREVGILERIY